jgi:hypothetical protein
VTVLPARDYGALMAHLQEGRAPLETIEASIDWLRQAPPGGTSATPQLQSVATSDEAVVTGAGRLVRERILTLVNPSGCSFGILSEPVDGQREELCAVLLNAGALRRIGPNRTWVELSRRWAARGVPTVRVDFEGIGDSDGDERNLVANRALYAQRMTDQTVAALDQLSDLDLPRRFVLVGLCSGAYWALQAALADPRVAGAFTVNLYSFYWSEQLVAERDRLETVAALRGGLLRRVARGGVKPYHVRRALRSIRFGSRSIEGSQESEVSLALDKLRDQGTEVLMALSAGEPLYDQFEREGRIARMDQWPNVTLKRISSADHMVRALWVQTLIHEELDSGLERLLERHGPSRATADSTIPRVAN